MCLIDKITKALSLQNYDMEAWDFRDQEPADCEEICRVWFNTRDIDYQLSKITAIINDDNQVIWLIDFTNALNAYWKSEGYSIDSAYYTVTLNV